MSQHNPETMLLDAKDVLDMLNIPYGNVTKVLVNYTANSRWGQCRYNSRTDSYVIEISARLLDEDVPYESGMSTMIHELLHAYKGRMNHTGEWKRYAEYINSQFPIYNIKRTNSSAEMSIDTSNIRYKYRIVCDKCGTESLYMRESRVVKLIKMGAGCYNCTKCGSSKFSIYTHN